MPSSFFRSILFDFFSLFLHLPVLIFVWEVLRGFAELSGALLFPVRGLEDALDVRLLQLVRAVGLDDLVHAHEGLLQGVERGGVDHLLLDLGRVRAPGHQEQLGPGKE